MPFIEIKALPNQNKRDKIAEVVNLAARIGSETLGAPLGAVLAVFEEIVPGWYSHEGDVSLGRKSTSHPVIVRVTAFSGRNSDQIGDCLKRLAQELAPRLGVSHENIFAVYHEEGSGRIYTKGSLKT